MSEIDAKVNMSLDEIIKLEKKEKKKQKAGSGGGGGGGGGTSGAGGTSSGAGGSTTASGGSNGRGAGKRNRGRLGGGGGGGPRIRGGRIGAGGSTGGITGKKSTNKTNKTNKASKINNKGQNWSKHGPNVRSTPAVRGGFVKKRYNKNGGLTRTRSNLTLNQNNQNRGSFNARGNNARNRFGLTRSKSRANLTFIQGGFFTNNKGSLKRTNSLPNLRDPTSVHNRLGYQSPAQVAYRNRVKRAKQLLLQRQNRLSLQSQFRAPQLGKPLTTLQQRTLERRQQILTSQRHFTTGGLRSDQIARAQRRAQYERKLLRINNAALNTNSNPNFMCTLGSEWTPSVRQRPMSLAQNRSTISGNSLRQLPRGRSPFRQIVQSLTLGRAPNAGRARSRSRSGSRSRSRSRSRTRNLTVSDAGSDVEDRTFSEVMYSLSSNFGVTGRTLNDRFSF